MLLVCVLSIQAQQTWTIEQCINYAIENSINVRQRIIARQNDEITLSTAKNSRLPNLNASVGENFNIGRAQNREGVYQDRTMSNTSMGISTSVPIFTGMRITNDIEAKKFSLAASVEETEQAKNDVAINVAGFFLQVLFNKEMVGVAEEQVLLTARQVEKTEQLMKGGRASQADLYEAKALLAKDEATLTQTKSTLQLSLVDLAQLMELTDVSAFNVVAPQIDALEGDQYSMLDVNDIYRTARVLRPAIKAAELRVESGLRQVKVARAGYLPTLNLNAGVNSGYYYDYTSGVNNLSFGDQLDKNRSSTIGLSLSIPIFNRFAVRNSVRQARLQVSNQQLSLELSHKQLLKEIQQAYYNSVTSRDKFIASQKSIEASAIAMQYAEEKYAAGRGTIFEFNDSKTRLIKSKSDLAQTRYEYIFRTKILDFYTGKPITLE